MADWLVILGILLGGLGSCEALTLKTLAAALAAVGLYALCKPPHRWLLSAGLAFGAGALRRVLLAQLWGFRESLRLGQLDLPPSQMTALLWAVLSGLLLMHRSRTGKPFSAAFLAALLPGLLRFGRRELPPAVFFLLYLWSLGLWLLTVRLYPKRPKDALRLLKKAAVPVALLALGGCLLSGGQHWATLRSSLSRLTAAQPPFTVSPRSTVSLRSLTPQPESGTAVMTVTSQRGGVLYLRMQDYDRYTGQDWEADDTRQEDFSGWGEAEDVVQISLSAYSQLRCLTYYPPPGTVLRGGCQPGTLRDYTLTVYRRGSAASFRQLAPYLRLSDETRAAVSGLLPKNCTPSDIASFTAATAVYDLQAPALPEDAEDFALWFLTEAERGYCVHFATAAVVLLRAAGYPARYVTGFRVETVPGVPTAVTTAEAHAWAEYYDADAGQWQLLEATPAAPAAVPEPQKTHTPLTVPAILWKVAAAGALAVLLCLTAQGRVRWLLRSLRLRRCRGAAQAVLLYREVQLYAALLEEPLPDSLEPLLQKALYSQYALTPAQLEPFRVFRRQCLRRLRRRPRLERLRLHLRYGVY